MGTIYNNFISKTIARSAMGTIKIKNNNNIINKEEDNIIIYNKIIKLLNLPLLDKNFINWFIGFVEGDGSFIINHRNDLIFVITQETKYDYILYYIQEKLGYGKVIKQSKTTMRFIIQNNLECYLIALLFHNNIRLSSKQDSYLKFINLINKKIKKNKFKFTKKLKKDNIIYNYINILSTNLKLKEITLNDAWLSGFIDAEGCFFCYIKIKKINYNYTIGFDIAQKNKENKEILLNKLISLFNSGNVYKHSVPNVWYYRIQGINNLKNIINYLDIYTLKSNKLNIYIIWKKIISWLSKKNHLNKNSNDFEKYIIMIKNLNK